ncbi:MAG: acyloxyacyl hydrolase [Paludibacteraceae bacterium]|nr:acyloxyacyl hydrolase [Paludibacteraceae bacterium]
MRRLELIIIFTAYTVMLDAEVVARYGVSGDVGTVMRGTIIENWIGNRPVLGGNASVEFLPTGRIPALQQYNNASVGIAAGYLNLTGNAVLGSAFTVYTYLNVPFVKRRYIEFGLRPGFGLSFVTKNYYNTVPDSLCYIPGSIQYPVSNGGFGSYTNAFFTTALYFRFPVKNGWAITASYGWYHISNGSIRQPNTGFNMFNGQLGVTYQPKAETYKEPERNVPHEMYDGKRWDVEMSLTGGIRQAYFADRRFFGIGAVQISAHWRPLSIFKLGGGVDLFYDGYYRSVNKEFSASVSDAPVTLYKKTYLSTGDIKNCFRVGISLQPEFVLGNFTLGLHAGVYLYDPVKNLEPYADAKDNKLSRGVFYNYDFMNAGVSQDGWLYLHVVMKYRVTNHLFVQIAAKSHMAKVEFFDAGLGVAL